MKNITILGAGPAGLGAAYRLHELGYRNFKIYESGSSIGGLCRSFEDNIGFTWDIGGHVMFSHYPYFDEVFDRLLEPEIELNNREAWIRLLNSWVPYPFQNNIRYLPRPACCDCLLGLVQAQGSGDPWQARNCAEFMSKVFGDGICNHFMYPYNFKVWAHPLEMMSHDWIGERVAIIDVDRALRNVLLDQDDFGWGPNNRFKFPRSGGTGEFCRRFMPFFKNHLFLNRQAITVDPQKHEIQFSDGSRESYGLLINTTPLDRLCLELIDNAPPAIQDAARLLKHSGGHMVGVGIRQPCPSTKSWMYFPENNSPFYRVTYLSNYSPTMTPDKENHYSLLCETSYSDLKPVNTSTITDQTVQGLISSGLLAEEDQDDIISLWHYDADYSYPVPTVERNRALSRLQPYLESVSIYSRGRFGMWKYEVGNTDHSMMQGVEVVNRLLLGEAEETIATVYKTVPGRKQALKTFTRPRNSIAVEELAVPQTA